MSDDFVPALKPLPEPEYHAPGGGRPDLPVAGLWARAMALAVDLALLSAAFYFFAHYAYESLYPARHATQPVAAILLFLYFWIGNGPLTAGQTAGKKLANLRVARRDGGKLTWGQAALRALFVLVLVQAYVSLPFITPFLALWPGFLPPADTYARFLFIVILPYATVGYALSNAVYCGLHPKKASLHDLLAKSMVVHAGRESEAAAFVAECDDVCQAKLKLAKWPAGTMALIFLVLLVQKATLDFPDLRMESAARKRIVQSLGENGFQFYAFTPPSREFALEFEKDLARAQRQRQEQHKPALTSETLRLYRDGRKMHLGFLCNETMTSRTLLADPRYKEMTKRLPPLAEDLRKSVLATREDSCSQPTHIQFEFHEVLPFYVYLRSRLVWADLIPSLGGDAATTRTAPAERPKPPVR